MTKQPSFQGVAAFLLVRQANANRVLEQRFRKRAPPAPTQQQSWSTIFKVVEKPFSNP
ncbi:hypothetical protein DB29_00147 [Shouchella clausii]|nr:hypothetical protein DB29_00147 [Shouchella clausii]